MCTAFPLWASSLLIFGLHPCMASGHSGGVATGLVRRQGDMEISASGHLAISTATTAFAKLRQVVEGQPQKASALEVGADLDRQHELIPSGVKQQWVREGTGIFRSTDGKFILRPCGQGLCRERAPERTKKSVEGIDDIIEEGPTQLLGGLPPMREAMTPDPEYAPSYDPITPSVISSAPVLAPPKPDIQYPTPRQLVVDTSDDKGDTSSTGTRLAANTAGAAEESTGRRNASGVSGQELGDSRKTVLTSKQQSSAARSDVREEEREDEMDEREDELDKREDELDKREKRDDALEEREEREDIENTTDANRTIKEREEREDGGNITEANRTINRQPDPMNAEIPKEPASNSSSHDKVHVAANQDDFAENLLGVEVPQVDDIVSSATPQKASGMRPVAHRQELVHIVANEVRANVQRRVSGNEEMPNHLAGLDERFPDPDGVDSTAEVRDFSARDLVGLGEHFPESDGAWPAAQYRKTQLSDESDSNHEAPPSFLQQ